MEGGYFDPEPPLPHSNTFTFSQPILPSRPLAALKNRKQELLALLATVKSDSEYQVCEQCRNYIRLHQILVTPSCFTIGLLILLILFPPPFCPSLHPQGHAPDTDLARGH